MDGRGRVNAGRPRSESGAFLAVLQVLLVFCGSFLSSDLGGLRVDCGNLLGRLGFGRIRGLVSNSLGVGFDNLSVSCGLLGNGLSLRQASPPSWTP